MKETLSKKQLREFGILIGLAFPIIIGWLLPVLIGHEIRKWTLCIGIPMLICGIFRPSLLFYPFKVWMKMGYALGWINSKLIMGIVFVFILLPIATIMKIFSYDPLRIKKHKKLSYRENREKYKFNFKRIF